MTDSNEPLPDDIAPLLRIGLDDAADADATLIATAPTPRSSHSGERVRGWNPPSVAELQRVLPQYDISAFIARGGMGAVYRGMQKTLKRPVAIKVLPPEIDDGDNQFAARFKHEAQAMAQLGHPNIVAVYDASETPDGLLYFVMEFIEGTDVAQLIASEGIIEPQRAIQITSAVCEALAFAHDEGIIHRDIKPSNIMLDRKGRVKVADFGLAKTLNMENTQITGTNLAMGTPDYIAPESLVAGMKVDQRADIYAVGVMLYQMLTGHLPRGRFELPSCIAPKLNKGFDAVVDKAMQTDRDKRYSTAAQMKTDIESVTMETAPAPSEAPELNHRLSRAKNAATMTAGQAKAGSAPARLPQYFIAGAFLMVGCGAFFLMREPSRRDTINAAGGESSPARAIPARPPTYAPGRWVKAWQNPQDIPNAGTVTEGWTMLNSVSAALHLPGTKGLNWGVRSRFLLAQGAPPPQLQLRDARGYGYNLIPMYDSIRFRRNDPSFPSHNMELGKYPLLLPKAGEEITLEFIIIGQRLIARLDGQTFTMVVDPQANSAQPGDVSLYQVDRNAFRDVEAINLDGLTEAQALKAAGVDLESATTVPPCKAYTFPVGQWVNPFQDSSDLESMLLQRGTTWQDGWISPGGGLNRIISLSTLNIFGKNWGLRARYRWEERAIAALNMRRAVTTDKSYVTHDFVVTSEEARFCRTTTYHDGRPTLTTALGPPESVKLLPNDEVVVEAFAIGATLFGRVNGQTFQVRTEGASDRGGFLASTTNMSFRGIEFLNLDGMSEAAALKAAGISGAAGNGK